MSNDAWAEAWSQLTRAIEAAYEVGMTDEEIQNTWDEAKPGDKPHVGGGPKRPKKGV